MRHAIRLVLSFGLVLLVPLFARAAETPLDLRSAVVVTPESLSRQESKAVDILIDEIEARTQLRPTITHSLPADQSPAIIAGTANSIKPFANARDLTAAPATAPEGFQLLSDPTTVWIIGNDSRGLLFGIGRLLRELHLSRQHIDLPAPLHLNTAPAMKIRGHQLGYRPKCNSYDGWTVAIWEQYIRDLAIFGCNTIELIPPRSDDQPDSPLFPLPQMQMMTEMSHLADSYGLDVSIWYPAMDNDYTKPETIEFALKEWGDVFSKLPRVDALFVPGGDPGHTRPTVLFALLEKQAANLHRFHPNAQIWLSPQSFDQEHLDEFFVELNKQPAWLTGIVYGPQVRITLSQCRKLTPARYPIRSYPDITHTHHCQYPVPDWDLAFAVTEAREPICPRPTQMANIFRVTRADTTGFVTYSEGCNDDVNKVIFSALGWDPDANPTTILQQYSRYFIDPRFEDAFAIGLFRLEGNWTGPVASHDAIDETLKMFRELEHAASPRVKLNWRFQQALYRAYYDAYVHSRLIYERKLERQAMSALDKAEKDGAVRAIDSAQQILNQAISAPVAQDIRARVFELAEALFQSIRMQLSVQRYGAESVHRGANLDRIDTPLNNRLWLTRQFDDIRKLDAEPARLARLRQITHWSDPGPGGFYDDLGDTTLQPHLVPGVGPTNDPDFYHTPMIRVEDRSEGGTAQPITWWSAAGTLFDQPLKLRYDGLDPKASYKVRVVYPPSSGGSLVRLVANEKDEIHPPLRKESQILEYPIPPQATANGRLELTWYPQLGRGHGGRNIQVAEVWLIHQEK